ncbi:unnamed protein product [Albugo candida]|uniref:Uncharacterized protein n=1 Tax=Albugo candida TaxID=65357 RepID=A0A024G3M0_9STRA|nr:unnamed protein product [Albugo candida]|eukprot:CCI41428.1 unnamed protein product [Albugo candida]
MIQYSSPMPSLKSDAKRSTRIDKDVKTRAQHSKIISILYDCMWSYRYYPYLAVLLLLFEAIIGYIIIHRVPCR